MAKKKAEQKPKIGRKANQKKVESDMTAQEAFEEEVRAAGADTVVIKVPSPKPKKVYSFETRVICPGCGSLNNYALETRGRVQKRTCRTMKCKHNTAFKGRSPFVQLGKEPSTP